MRWLAYCLFLLLIFVSSWENMIFFEGIGRISRVVGIGVSAVWVVSVLLTGQIRRLQPFHIAFGLFVLWCATSVLWSVEIPATVERVKTFAQLILLVVIFWDVCRTTVHIEFAMQAYLLGGLVSIASVISNFWQSSEVMHQRFAASGFNPNDFGLIVALGIPMAWYLAVFGEHCRRSRLLTALNYAYVPAALTGILLAASRGSLLASSPFLLFFALTIGRVPYLPRTILLVGIGLFALALPFVAPEASVARLLTATESIRAGDMNGRVAIWREGFEILSQHQWIGTGSGTYRYAATESRTVAHNVFVSVFVELGFVGLILIVGTLCMVVRDAVCLPRFKSMLWTTVLLIWLLGALVHTWEQRKQTWLVMSFVTATAAACCSRPTARTEPPVQLSTRFQGAGS